MSLMMITMLRNESAFCPVHRYEIIGVPGCVSVSHIVQLPVMLKTDAPFEIQQQCYGWKDDKTLDDLHYLLQFIII